MKIFNHNHLIAIRKAMHGLVNPDTVYGLRFFYANTASLRERAKKIADENEATLTITPTANGEMASCYFLPKEREFEYDIPTDTVAFLGSCLTDYYRRDDVAWMDDKFKAYDDAVCEYGKDDERTREALAGAEKAENELLVEALKTALKAGRIILVERELI